ncbi:MAG: hypothetical protein Q8L48_43280 [Archangium sp.]|nr:hypothetical protein [Archangium sp.]
MLAALLLLAATPVSLTVDLSRNTTARLGPRVRELIEQRLLEEGFAVEPGGKLKLGVEELHGTLRLSAQAGEYSATSELRPAIEWPAELGFELAQRLAVLAHEAEAHVPAKPVVAVVAEPEPPVDPPVEAPPVVAPPVPPPPVERPLRLGAGLRVGILVRGPAVDPTISFHGALPTGVVEPLVSMGLTLGPGPGLTAWEVPLAGGLRIPIVLSAWTIAPEVLGGGRLHFFGGSALDPAGGVRFDPLGMIGVSVLRAIGAIRGGARVGVELSTGREHRQGDEVLWGRSGFGFSAMLQVER